MTSRRVRGPAAHRVADRAATCKTLSVCYLPSRAPRRWRGGAMGTSRPTATGPHHGARGVRMMAVSRNGNTAWARACGMRPCARAIRTATWHGGNQAYRRKQGDKLEGKFCLKGKDQFGRIAPTKAPERCLSGLRCLTRNQVYRKVPGVRIPLSPPFFCAFSVCPEKSKSCLLPKSFVQRILRLFAPCAEIHSESSRRSFWSE